MGDRALWMALVISMLLHVTILLIPQRWPQLAIRHPQAEAEPIEVTYVRPAQPKVPARSMAFVPQRATPPAKPAQTTVVQEVRPVSASDEPQPSADAPKPSPQPQEVQVQRPQVDVIPSTERVTALLASYGETLRAQLQQRFDAAARDVGRTGLVTLVLRISRAGVVEQVGILPEESVPDRELQRATLAIIAQVAQLAAFPVGLDYSSLHFKIPIVFESTQK